MGTTRRDRGDVQDREHWRQLDNAFAETVNEYHTPELVCGPTKSGKWKTIEDLELTALGWAHWHNIKRLHGGLSVVPPLEYEESFYAGVSSAKTWLKSNELSLH